MRLGFFALSQLSVLPSSVSILIEVAAGTLDCSAVGLSPRPEQVEGHNQRFSAFGQLVIHPWRIRRVNRSRDKAIALQALQRQRQHALRDTLDQLEDLAEIPSTSLKLW